MNAESEQTIQTYDRATLLRRGAAAGGALALASWLPALAGARRESTTLNLVAYSTPKPVMAALITNWQATAQGQGVSFTQSYGPSTSQAQAVAAGLPADLVFLSWPGRRPDPRRRRPRQRELERAVLPRHRGEHGRRLRAPATATRRTSRAGTT